MFLSIWFYDKILNLIFITVMHAYMYITKLIVNIYIFTSILYKHMQYDNNVTKMTGHSTEPVFILSDDKGRMINWNKQQSVMLVCIETSFISTYQHTM